MSAFAKRAALSALSLAVLAGCARTAAPARNSQAASANTAGRSDTSGVTANSGGDTRGTVLYQPAPRSAPANPYALVSDKFVLAQRQKMAWALAEIDRHAHQQAARAYPVPQASAPGYSKQTALAQAERQAQFNAYLLEKYHARFCNQFHVSYDQIALLIKEGREKNWPIPPALSQGADDHRNGHGH